ncbi:MAG: transporter [Pseudomonadota bacterium]
MRTFCLGAAAAACLATPVVADHETVAKDHAPIGVMGDHMHDKGEIMFSYRFMRMNMEGSRIGTEGVSPEEIATTVPNRFFGAPMQPPTLRVVPTEMSMNMHMLGVMYAPADWLTLMAMGSVVTKSMDHITFQGGMGTTRLGEFTTETEGFGDTKLSGLVRLFDIEQGDVKHHAHINAGISIPTGSITRTDDILTPMGATPSPRLPYPMQVGSGTVDFAPGVTYTGSSEIFSWGGQAMATIRAGDNDEGYALGDVYEATAWAMFGPSPWWAVSGRAAFRAQAAIDGIDPLIVAPVQTADPDNQGGDRLDLGVGANFAGQTGVIRGHRLAVEVLFPVYQDLNGPQLETDLTFSVGWQKAF